MSGSERERLLQAFDSNWITTMGAAVDGFEADVVAFTGAEAAVALASGTAALHLALVVAGVRAGDEVWVSTLTFAAPANAVVYTGASLRFIDSDRTKLSGQAGVGYRRLKNAVTGQTDGDVIFGGEAKFEHALTDTTKIIDKLVVEAGSDNTFVANDLALEVKINAAFALSAAVGVRYNSDPPLGRKSTDTLTTVNLVYSY